MSKKLYETDSVKLFNPDYIKTDNPNKRPKIKTPNTSNSENMPEDIDISNFKNVEIERFPLLWGIVGFIIPIIGIILYFVWKASKPMASKYAGWGAAISIALNALRIMIGI